MWQSQVFKMGRAFWPDVGDEDIGDVCWSEHLKLWCLPKLGKWLQQILEQCLRPLSSVSYCKNNLEDPEKVWVLLKKECKLSDKYVSNTQPLQLYSKSHDRGWGFSFVMCSWTIFGQSLSVSQASWWKPPQQHFSSLKLAKLLGSMQLPLTQSMQHF